MSKVICIYEANILVPHSPLLIDSLKERLSVKQITKDFNIPENYLPKVLQRLSKEQIQKSNRKSKDRIELLKSVKNFNYLQVCELISGKLSDDFYFLEKKEFHFKKRPFEDIIVKFTKKYQDFLKSNTLVDLN